MGLLNFGSIRVDLEHRLVERESSSERLTTLEASVLGYLLRANRVVPREELLSEVWGYSDAVVSRAVDNTVRRLRMKIEEDPSNPMFLLTMHGTGYRIVSGEAAPPAPQAPAEPSPAHPRRRYLFDDRALDLDRQHIEHNGATIAISGRELEILELLAAARGSAIAKETLQRKVWGTAAGRALENTIARVRRKLESDPSAPRILLTTASGYRLALPGEEPTPVQEPLVCAPLPSLPAELDRRFGREEELAEILAAFAAGDRTVVLLGPAGIGKSRLALTAGRALSAEGKRTLWVPASPARDRASLCAIVARALQVQLSTQDPSRDLCDFLAREEPLWLIIDNLEQIAGAAVEITSWLRAAPKLRVLATSRTRLHIQGERALSLPPLGARAAADLFADRAARAVRPSEEDDVLALVNSLDCLPLAIELAAARTRALSIAQIRAQTDQLSLLSGRQGDEHRSIRASLDASLLLLPPDVRSAFCQLSVFEGPFSAYAAEAVVAIPSGSSGLWLIDALQELCDASLLRFDADRGRFSLLRVVRQYAADKLPEQEHPALYERHGRFCASILSRIGASERDAFFGPRHNEIASALTEEIYDLEAALDRATEHEDDTVAVAIASALFLAWRNRGPYAPAIVRVDRLLARPLPPAQRAEIELLAGFLRGALGESAAACRHLQAAIALAQEVGATDIEQEARFDLVRRHLDLKQIDEMNAEAERALALARAHGRWSIVCRIALVLSVSDTDLDVSYAHLQHAERIALDHGAFGLLAWIERRFVEVEMKRGRIREAERHIARAWTLASDTGNLVEQMALNGCQAYLLRVKGQIAESLPFCRAGASDARRIGWRASEAITQQQLGWSLSLLGRHEESRQAYLHALAVSRAIDLRAHSCDALNGLGALSAQRTDREHPLQEAESWFREALAEAHTIDDPHRQAMSQLNLGKVCCLSGKWAEGVALLQGAYDLYHQRGDQRRAGAVLAVLGDALTEQGQLSEARVRLEEASNIAERRSDRTLADILGPVWARLLARSGEIAAAEATLAAYTRTDDHVREADLAYARAEIAHARGDIPSRQQALTEAARLVHPDALGQRFRALLALD